MIGPQLFFNLCWAVNTASLFEANLPPKVLQRPQGSRITTKMLAAASIACASLEVGILAEVQEKVKGCGGQLKLKVLSYSLSETEASIRYAINSSSRWGKLREW